MTTFMFAFDFSFLNLTFHLLQFSSELSAKPSWLDGNTEMSAFHKVFLCLQMKGQLVPAEMSPGDLRLHVRLLSL